MIDAARLGQTFKRLAEIESPSRQEAGVSDAIVEMLKPLGAQVYIDDAAKKLQGDTGNLIVRFAGNQAVAPMMLNAHMDTVGPTKGIRVLFKDGVFTSDGSTVLGSDDKSAIAIIIECIRVIHENNLPCPPLELVFTVCEEIGLLGAECLDMSLLKSRFGYCLDTDNPDVLVTRAPWANRINITVHGCSAHAGMAPETGINAIQVAAEAIAGLQLGRIDADTTCNIGVISGGIATNIVPETVNVSGEARSHDAHVLAQVTQKITQGFEDAISHWRRKSGSETLPSVDVQVETEFEGTHIPENHPVAVLAQQAAHNLGRQLSYAKTGGGADANVFFNAGVVTGVLGTGMTRVHTVRESVKLDDMVKTAELVLEIVRLHATGQAN